MAVLCGEAVSSDCCDCCKENFYLNAFDAGPHVGDYWPTFRGDVSGSFSAGPGAGVTLSGIPHFDWCCVRPSIASFNAIAGAPNSGTLRLFVESTRDLATNVWAEAKTDIPLFDSFVLGEHDYVDGMPALVPREERRPSNTYVPAFGYGAEVSITGPTGSPTGPTGATGGLSTLGGGSPTGPTGSTTGPTGSSWQPNSVPGFVFRNAEDDDAYFLSQWPVADPYVVTYEDSATPKEFLANTLSVRCGSSQSNSDTIALECLSILNLYGPLSTSNYVPASSFAIRAGAFVEDRLHVAETVPCGIYVQYGHNSEQSWSWPFEVPRAVITSTEQIETPRYIGLQQTANQGVVSPFAFEAFTACAANSAAVLPALAEESIASVPVIAWVPTAPAINTEITESSPYYARRSDLVLNVPHNVPNGSAWHASHIVREASSLAMPGELHELELELLPHDNETPVITPIFFTGTYGNSNVGLRLTLRDDDPFPWNAISATTYTFVPQIQEKQLFPNQWHYWSEQPQRSFTYDIDTPSVNALADPQPPLEVSEENLALLNGTVFRAEDFRVAFKYETALQGFVFTGLAAVQHINPLDISLSDSGMASHDWDKIKNEGVQTATPQVTLHCMFRVREKWTVTEVKGFSREWEIGTQTVTGPGETGGESQLGGGTSTGTTGTATSVAVFQQTGNVRTVMTASGTDVAITEKNYSFSTDISEHIGALADGTRVEIPLTIQDVHQRAMKLQLKRGEIHNN